MIIERFNKKVANQSHLHVLTETDEEIDVTQLQQISVGFLLILAFAGHDARRCRFPDARNLWTTKEVIGLSISALNL